MYVLNIIIDIKIGLVVNIMKFIKVILNKMKMFIILVM